jgi:hypothetical protein
MTDEKYYNENQLIDPSALDLEDVPGRSYRTFDPVPARVDDVCMVEYAHLLFVRINAYDVIGEEYFFIRPYRVGKTSHGELVFIVVETQTKGGCHVIDQRGEIAGDGFGRSYGVLCPADAEATLVADLAGLEKYRQSEMPQALYCGRT